jgi:hypothetical protein
VALTVLPRRPKAEPNPKKKGIGRPPQGAPLVVELLSPLNDTSPTTAHVERGDSAAAAQHTRGRHVTGQKPVQKPPRVASALGVAAGNVATSDGRRASISLAKGRGGGSKPRAAGPLASKENRPAVVDHRAKPHGRNGKGRRGGSKQSAGTDGAKRRDTNSDGPRRNRPQGGAALRQCVNSDTCPRPTTRRVVKQSTLTAGITSITLSADGKIAARAAYGEPKQAAPRRVQLYDIEPTQAAPVRYHVIL